MVTSFKLKKVHYSDLEKLLKNAHLVDGDNAYPNKIFVNKRTYTKITKAIRLAYLKKYPFVSRKNLEFSIQSYLLNLGPSINNALKDGYALVVL